MRTLCISQSNSLDHCPLGGTDRSWICSLQCGHEIGQEQTVRHEGVGGVDGPESPVAEWNGHGVRDPGEESAIGEQNARHRQSHQEVEEHHQHRVRLPGEDLVHDEVMGPLQQRHQTLGTSSWVYRRRAGSSLWTIAREEKCALWLWPW